MSGDTNDPDSRRWPTLRPVAHLLLILLVTSCASGPGGGSPTSPPIPSIPAITPIVPRAEASPTPQPTARPSATTPPTAEPSPAPAQPATHVVQPGDTLLGLARQYDVPMAAIQLENDMGPSTVVRAGQSLTIPSADGWEDASPFWIVHEVQAGETLSGIAQAYDVELDDLRAANGLESDDRITVGQSLILPLASPAAAPAPPPTDLPPATAAPLPTASPAATATNSTETTPIPPTSPAPTPAVEALPPADLASWPGEIARLINQVRAEHGLPPFTYNQTLEQAAQAHANDCADRGWGSHTGSDGANIKLRVARAGYDGSGWAECWAWVQTPQKAMEVWMNETPPNDPHRRTLLSEWLTEVGVGVAKADWGHYIFADFGRP